MFQFTDGFCRAWRGALCGASALLLVVGCPSSGLSQQAASQASPALPAKENRAVSPPKIDASKNALVDTQEGIRKGALFYATAPLPEKVLRQADGTTAGVSFTVPLTVDRVHNRLSAQALINNKKCRLILDTGGGPVVSLDQATARGIKLAGRTPVQIGGVQGREAATLGRAKSLTLGNLTLGQIAITVVGKTPANMSTLGLSAFQHYRVTLDFAANTMTLTRGGVPRTLPGGASLSIPFNDDGGYIFIPARVLSQDGWAVLDSGSDVNCLPFRAAKAAAAQLPASDSKTVTRDQKIGLGNTDKKFSAIVLKASLPISLNTGHDDAAFSTTSRVGTSDIDNVLNSMFDTHIVAQLGFPFLLQFGRVIIDYPNHTLTLQYPAHDNFIKVALSPTDHDEAWPGYKWRQKGYAWIEVPDGKSAPASSSIPANSATAPAKTTSTTSATVITSSDGGVTVTVNGTKIACPSGSTIQVGADGVVHILPPGNSPSK